MSAWTEQFGTAGVPGDASAQLAGRGVKYMKVECTEEKAKSNLALKLGVIANQKVRLLEAACTVQIEIPVDGTLCVALLRAHNEEYLPRVRGKAGHGLGPPDSFLCTAACLTLVETTTAEFKADVQEYLA
eukprot:4818077-Pyramimonas_sp.AAC.1